MVWTKMRAVPGGIRDLAVTHDNKLFAIGGNPMDGGFAVYRRAPSSLWEPLPWAGAVKIAVDSSQFPWIISSRNEVFRLNWNTKAWVKMAEGYGPHDIAIGPGDTVYALGPTIVGASGYNVYKWNNGSWAQLSIGGVQKIAVDADGRFWGIDTGGKVLCAFPTSTSLQPWETPAPAFDISACGSGTKQVIAIADVNQDVWVYDGAYWTPHADRSALAVAVSSDTVYAYSPGSQFIYSSPTNPT